MQELSHSDRCPLAPGSFSATANPAITYRIKPRAPLSLGYCSSLVLSQSSGCWQSCHPPQLLSPQAKPGFPGTSQGGVNLVKRFLAA